MNATTLTNYTTDASLMPQTASRGLFARLGAIVAWVGELPRRQAVIAELAELSDHELADIGLVRSDLGRVFNADFAASRARAQISRTSAV